MKKISDKIYSIIEFINKYNTDTIKFLKKRKN